MNAEQVQQAITAAMVKTMLEALKVLVFPHQVLKIQRLWMNHRMFKPAELSMRKTAVANNHLNNVLPLFPSGMDESKFMEVKFVGLLEFGVVPTACIADKI